MFVAAILNQPVVLPRISLGRLRSLFKVSPVRPNSKELSAEIVATIAEYENRVVHGRVYKLGDDRCFYAPTHGLTGELKIDSIQELGNPHPDILSCEKGNGADNIQPFAKLRASDPKGIVTDPLVKAAIVRAHYPKNAPRKLIEFSLA